MLYLNRWQRLRADTSRNTKRSDTSAYIQTPGVNRGRNGGSADSEASPQRRSLPGSSSPTRASEYAAINSMLDQISSCLDHLEEKNDHLHACLKELLESNRQTRLEFQQQSEQHSMGADMQGPQPPV